MTVACAVGTCDTALRARSANGKSVALALVGTACCCASNSARFADTLKQAASSALDGAPLEPLFALPLTFTFASPPANSDEVRCGGFGWA